MPTNYDYKRRIGSIVRTGAAIKAFSQLGDEFLWTTAVLDVDATNPGTLAVTATLTVPTGVKVWAKFNTVSINGTVNHSVYFSSLDQTDEAASNTVAPLAALGFSGGVAGFTGWNSIRTNTLGQIRYRLDGSGAGDVLRLATFGFSDRRGRDD